MTTSSSRSSCALLSWPSVDAAGASVLEDEDKVLNLAKSTEGAIRRKWYNICNAHPEKSFSQVIQEQDHLDRIDWNRDMSHYDSTWKAGKGGDSKKKGTGDKKAEVQFDVGDQLLLSKDRMGVLRYAGEIPELGAGIWYGVELTDGSVGQTDGAVKGKRYFQCDDKRALFVPLLKIRRKMNAKDEQRLSQVNYIELN